jgi:hypothetical protein
MEKRGQPGGQEVREARARNAEWARDVLEAEARGSRRTVRVGARGGGARVRRADAGDISLARAGNGRERRGALALGHAPEPGGGGDLPGAEERGQRHSTAEGSPDGVHLRAMGWRRKGQLGSTTRTRGARWA